MKNALRKLTACATAAVTLALSIGSLSASAITPALVPNSKLDYSVYVEQVAGYTNRVRVTFHIVNNPGFYNISVLFQCDKDCTPIEKSAKWSNPGLPGVGVIEKPGSNASIEWANNENPSDKIDFKEDLDLSLEYNVSGSTSKAHEFKVGVYDYTSYTEGINVSTIYGTPEYIKAVNQTSIKVGEKQSALVGDLDGDKNITSKDATCLQQILSFASNQKFVTENPAQITISELNNAICDYPTLWTTNMKGLICADVANVNGDNFITSADTTELLDYTARISAGLPTINQYINKYVTTTIVM